MIQYLKHALVNAHLESIMIRARDIVYSAQVIVKDVMGLLMVIVSCAQQIFTRMLTRSNVNRVVK